MEEIHSKCELELWPAGADENNNSNNNNYDNKAKDSDETATYSASNEKSSSIKAQLEIPPKYDSNERRQIGNRKNSNIQL